MLGEFLLWVRCSSTHCVLCINSFNPLNSPGKKHRLKEVKSFTEGQIAEKWCQQDLNQCIMEKDKADPHWSLP